MTGIPANTYSPYFAPGHLVPALLGPDPSAVASQLGPVVPQAVQVAQQKIPRSDRLEVSYDVYACCKTFDLKRIYQFCFTKTLTYRFVSIITIYNKN